MKTEKLVKQFRQGNQLAAQQLYQLYAKGIYNSLLRLGLEKEEAQDLLQEAFIKAFQSIASLDQAKAFGGWLKRIALNLGLQFIRKQNKMQSFDPLEDQMDLEEEEDDWPEIQFEDLKKALSKLPKGCRLIFELFYLDDYNHQEIAGELQISVSTSKSQLHYAKRLLKEQLMKHYEA